MVLVVLLAVSLGATAGDREDVEMLQIQSRLGHPMKKPWTKKRFHERDSMKHWDVPSGKLT